jgi:hypothetical protein
LVEQEGGSKEKARLHTGLIRGSESASLYMGGDAIPSSAMLSPSNVEGNKNLLSLISGILPG